MRVVVVLGLATAALIDAAFGPGKGKHTGETALFRQLLGSLKKGDVVVADRYYCSFWLVALLRQRGVDAAFRLHQRRRYDFRRGQRLGRCDHVVSWAKPARPDWMDEPTYAALPDELEVRELRFAVDEPGYRSRQIVVATTLTDATEYPKTEVADLYHGRWHVELDLRSLKQALKMERPTCKTPEMARKEAWAHFLAYDLVRQTMAEAARAGQCQPRQLSFAGAQQTLEAFRWLLLLAGPGAWREQLVAALRSAVGTHRVGNRPGRIEPRAVKRRPKEYDRLMKPRAEARAELLGGTRGGEIV
jgi:putative transposase